MLRLAVIAIVLIATPALGETRLVLPVEGEWLAVDGPPCVGPCPARNIAFALRLAPLDPFGRPAPSCLNRPVMSPTDGTVIAVADDVANGESAAHPFANHVVIARDSGETIVLANLAQGSVTVAAGDTVRAGETIARCGGAALHVHMQATRDILDRDSEGLPMPFANLSVRTPGGCMATTFLYRGQGTC